MTRKRSQGSAKLPSRVRLLVGRGIWRAQSSHSARAENDASTPAQAELRTTGSLAIPGASPYRERKRTQGMAKMHQFVGLELTLVPRIKPKRPAVFIQSPQRFSSTELVELSTLVSRPKTPLDHKSNVPYPNCTRAVVRDAFRRKIWSRSLMLTPIRGGWT
jgi:hypothetical protein